MSIMGLNIHVRVIKPLAVDRTEVTIYPIRLVGAPDGDELRQYPSAQRYPFQPPHSCRPMILICRARAKGAAKPAYRLGEYFA